MSVIHQFFYYNSISTVFSSNLIYSSRKKFNLCGFKIFFSIIENQKVKMFPL